MLAPFAFQGALDYIKTELNWFDGIKIQLKESFMTRKNENSMGDVAEHLGEAGAAVREKLSDCVDAAKDMGVRIQKQAVAGVQSTDRVIRDHPYQSLGIAFGVGILIGVLVARK